MAVKLKGTITESDVDLINNTSKVTVNLTATWTYNSHNYNDKSGYIIIDGTKYTFKNSFNDNNSEEGSKLLATKEKTVTHDADGSKTVTCSGYYQTGVSSGNITWSGNKKLTDIPRNATFNSIPDFIFDNGTPFEVPITSYVSTYYNVLQIKYNDTLIAERLNYVGNTVQLTTDEINLAYSLMTTNTAQWNFLLSTYTDSTLATPIGTTATAQGNATINAEGRNPTFNNADISAIDTNSETVSITGNSNIFIKNHSNLAITLNTLAIANKGATLGNDAYTFYSEGLPTQYANQSDTLPIVKTFENIQNNQYVVTATDSRGNSTSYNKQIDMIDYFKPIVNNLSVRRAEPDLIGEVAQINISGAFDNWNDLQVSNNLTGKYRYRENFSTSNWSEFTDFPIIINENTFSGVTNTNNVFDVEKTYIIEVTISDLLDSTTKEAILLNAMPTMDIDTNNNAVAIAKVLENPNDNSLELKKPLNIAYGGTGATTQIGALENLKVYPIGSVYMTSTNENPSSYLGGTWELVDKEFTPKIYTQDDDLITINTTYISSYTASCAVGGHSVCLTVGLTNKVEIQDTELVMGTINLNAIGVNSLGILGRVSGWSDGGEAIVMYAIGRDGEIHTMDSQPNYATKGYANYWTITYVITPNNMLDSACNKFYWKRTA